MNELKKSSSHSLGNRIEVMLNNIMIDEDNNDNNANKPKKEKLLTFSDDEDFGESSEDNKEEESEEENKDDNFIESKENFNKVFFPEPNNENQDQENENFTRKQRKCQTFNTVKIEQLKTLPLFNQNIEENVLPKQHSPNKNIYFRNKNILLPHQNNFNPPINLRHGYYDVNKKNTVISTNSNESANTGITSISNISGINQLNLANQRINPPFNIIQEQSIYPKRNEQRKSTYDNPIYNYPFNNNNICYPINPGIIRNSYKNNTLNLPNLNGNINWINIQNNICLGNNNQINFNPLNNINNSPNLIQQPVNTFFQRSNLKLQNNINAQQIPFINPQNIINLQNSNNIPNTQLSLNQSNTIFKTQKIEGKDLNLIPNLNVETKRHQTNPIPSHEVSNLKLELLLYELKTSLSKSGKIDYFIFSKLQGNFVSIIKTHKGSRIFQNYLKNTHADIIHQIYQEISPSLVEILNDSYANYFCKKFFLYLNQKDRIDFLQTIQPSITSLSLSNIGTYPIQGIIEQIGSKIEKKIFIDALLDSIPEFCLNTYGTHILEKILNCFEEDLTKPIVDYVVANFLTLSNNINGICVVKKLLTFTHKKDLHEILKKFVKDNLFTLIEQPYGNFVIHVVIENWDELEVEELLQEFKGKFFILSLQKYGSNVVERLIEKNEKMLKLFIKEITTNGRIHEIMKSSFGNYVIQKALKLTKGDLKKILVSKVSEGIHRLNDKKLNAKWKSILELNKE